MKKFLAIQAAALMVASTVNAANFDDNGYESTKHEVALSYGFGSNSQLIDDMEKILVAPLGARMGSDHYAGPISGEYFYHVKSWCGVGGILTFGRNKESMTVAGADAGNLINTYYTVLPAVKFDWLRRRNFGLYSKLGLGATIRHEKIADNPLGKDDSDTQAHFNWQASLVGFEAGSPCIRGFAELGFGEQGIFLAGVRYKF